jgi:hypothetical protein
VATFFFFKKFCFSLTCSSSSHPKSFSAKPKGKMSAFSHFHHSSHSLSLLPPHHSLLQNSLPHRTEYQGALVGFAAVGFLLLAKPSPSKKKSLRPQLIIPRKYHWRVRGVSTDCAFSWEPVLFRFLCYFPAFRFACAYFEKEQNF